MHPARYENGLFGAIERALKASKEPLDCVDLFGNRQVRELAGTTNRVSDYLGHMWRRGLVLRLPATKVDGSKTKWQYMWKPAMQAKLPPDLSLATAYDEHVEQLLTRPNLQVTEEGDTVVITLPSITITIKQNK